MSDGPDHVEFQIELPGKVETGVPADFASLWHTPTSFVIDFVATKGPAQIGEDDEGQPVQVIPAKVVSRIRIPPEQVFELAKALTQQLSMWENETGKTASDE
ncbi:hypothetical protein GCM10010401_00790 [Rarobacter faecitabidus]|uniref:Uncharacterized protein DUF3467 n=1 Tax=Rarobacter faecitabidus TaxID=13243 RepID=A0A542ZWQ0_RARFA|nr:DUF3467 domain-containing protein [Rarobacter faecitabidus]TQL64781.1 uncharacterized protein DUF3467 [Rarobacter faecitabidus]